MVAENISILRSWGRYDKISSIESRKPMLSISSASSRITVCTLSSFTSPRLMRSMRRPGVATTMCTPRRNERIWLSMLEPPYTANTLRLEIYLAKSSRSLPICKQSSRVGESINACGADIEVSVRCKTGKPNAAVLPVPVCANATTSPSTLSKWGITLSCTGMGRSKPNSAIARNKSSLTPNSSNVILYYLSN